MLRKTHKTFPFGKYKGKNIIDILKVNPKYVLWFTSNIRDVQLDEEITAIIQEYRKKRPPTRTYLCGDPEGEDDADWYDYGEDYY